MNVYRTRVSVGVVVVGLMAGMANAVILPVDYLYVPVGNPGNAADTRYNSISVGSVATAYNIGKYEVTAVQYTAFLNAVAKTDTYGLYNTNMGSDTYGCKIQRTGSSPNFTYTVAADYANRPVNYVSWGDAARFANWMEKGQPTGLQTALTTEDGSYLLNGANTNTALLAVTRKVGAKWVIPSENEWYKAAYHKNDGVLNHYWDYAAISNTAPGQDKTDVSGNNANWYTPPSLWPIDGAGHYTTVAGEFQNSDSPYGTFDQGGNVTEWNEAVIGTVRGLRGGSFNDDIPGRLGASYREAGLGYPTQESGTVGFRLAVPEPATIVMLALAGVGIIRRRKA